MRIPPLVQLASIVFLACSMSACRSPDNVRLHHLAAYHGNVRIGHSVRSRAVFGDRVVTTDRSVLSVRKAGQEIDCRSDYLYTETADGQPVSFRAFETKNGRTTRRAIGHITGGQLNARVMIDDEWQDRTLPWPKDALLPEGLRLLREREGLAEGTSYEKVVFDARAMTAVRSRVTVGAAIPVDMLGTVAELTPLAVAPDRRGGAEAVKYVDAEFDTVKSISPLLGSQLVYIACDRADALRPIDPIEQAGLGSMPSPVALTSAQRAATLTYTLKPKHERLSLPADNTQTVSPGADGLLEVTVSRTGDRPSGELPYAGEDPALLAALAPDAYVRSDDPRIVAPAQRAVGGAEDARRAVERLERFVFRHVNRGEHYPGCGTAVEVIESRRGDCTEHAVLLAAMCRAVGIPAQVVTGLAYTNGSDGLGKFASHAWVRVWVGDQWLHVDSTRRRVDAGYIMLAVGDESVEGFPSSMDKFDQFDIDQVIAPDAVNGAADAPAEP